MHVLSHQQFDFMVFVHPISNQWNDFQLWLLTTNKTHQNACFSFTWTCRCMTSEIKPLLQTHEGLEHLWPPHFQTHQQPCCPSRSLFYQLSSNCPSQLCSQLIFTWRVRLCQHFSHCVFIAIIVDNVQNAQEVLSVLVSGAGPSVRWLSVSACFAS